jgi:hypothetical protein
MLLDDGQSTDLIQIWFDGCHRQRRLHERLASKTPEVLVR